MIDFVVVIARFLKYYEQFGVYIFMEASIVNDNKYSIKYSIKYSHNSQ